MTDSDELEPWQQYTDQFAGRAQAVGNTHFDSLNEHLRKLPQAPFPFEFTDLTAIRFQLAMLVIGSLRSAREIALSASGLWLKGHFLLASVGFRMLIELDGQLLWAEKKVLRRLEEDDAEALRERVAKLILGAKSTVPLVRGEFGPHPTINVMDFVRSSEESRPGAMEDYVFLCDATHPCYMMQTWLIFAGPRYDNWTNETFALQVAKVLDRMLVIAETSLQSLEDTALRIISAALPQILSEAETSSAKS